ncbi:MAG TPA: DUF1015 domain-containing protein, partial [Candidatus Nitrosotenuis sp.]|nr:DUF1015 domain-containing protein [Candidatus Nitrosotenuis sp.]
MADFRPLRGVRYNPQTVSDLSRVTAPPYDKIDAEQARRYRALDPHNIVHLTLPEGEGQGRYERARQLFFRWLEEKVLCLEDRPCFYLYQQEFPFGEETLSRTGWLGALRAVPYEEQVVMPHEYTLKGPIEDRLSLLKATGVHFESIFLLYPDTQGWTGRQVAELTRGAPV